MQANDNQSTKKFLVSQQKNHLQNAEQRAVSTEHIVETAERTVERGEQNSESGSESDV